MKIVIINQHSCNRGDEAAGRAVIDSLLKAFPDCTIDVLYRFIGEYPPIWYNTDRVHHYTELKYKYDKSKIVQYYFEIVWNFFIGILRLKKGFIGASGKIYEKIANADIIVNAPTGPNIGDIYKDKLYMLNLIFSVLTGKKTFMYGSSVGPFNIPWVKKWSKFLFERMNYICVREDVSLDYLKSLALKNKNITSSLDAAIQREIATDNAVELYKNAGFTLNKKNIGITPLAYLWYPKEMKNEETQEKVENNLVKVIDEITKNNDTNVFFFPQLFHCDGDLDIHKNDMPIINSIISKVNKPEFCKIIPNEYDSDMQQSMISKLDYFIGMRYHSIIFSVKMGIPVIGICYEHKANGFLEKACLPELIVNLSDFISDYNVILHKVDYINENRTTIVEKITKALPKLQKISNKGTHLIVEYLSKK